MPKLKKAIIFLTVSFGVLFFAKISSATVIFQDNFDYLSTNWKCTDGVPGNWTPGWMTCASTNNDGFGAEARMCAGHSPPNAYCVYKKQFQIATGTAGAGSGTAMGPGNRVLGTGTGWTYYCIQDHISSTDNRPTTGANWATYWKLGINAGGGSPWVEGQNYSAGHCCPGFESASLYKLYDANANFGNENANKYTEGLSLIHNVNDKELYPWSNVTCVQDPKTIWVYPYYLNKNIQNGEPYEIFGLSNSYRGELDYWIPPSDAKNEVYHRWYMKIPTPAQFDKNTSGCKMWRYILREYGYSGGYSGEIYLQLAHWSNRISDGDMSLLVSITGAMWKLKHNADQMDDKWYSHEIRIKLNSPGNNDGIIQYWFDGVLEKNYTDINFGMDSSQPLGIHKFGVGIGNCDNPPWDQTEWSAIAFDDVVVSTNYIGPISSDTTPPAPPTGVTVI